MKNLLFFVLIFSLTLSCEKQNTSCSCEDPAPCDALALLDNSAYQNGSDDPYFLREASIEGDCLYLRFQYGGGCKEVDFDLVGAFQLGETAPLTRFVRVALDDDDNCEALITEEVTFNLKPLRVEGEEELRILIGNPAGEDLSVIYTY
ncbi:MAG: hypothetical protein GVY26_06190 [Bacteroidetes bacterium]|jgi:hypothetical protein|nr:hypothetical protein [Bacteroidota bacterium]